MRFVIRHGSHQVKSENEKFYFRIKACENIHHRHKTAPQDKMGTEGIPSRR